MGWYKPGTGKPVALSEFAPDKNVLEPGILLDAVGAQPTLAGFSPLANLVGLAPALAGRPVGSLYAYYSNESATLFAAIDNGAGVSWYGLDTALNTWVPLTGPTVNPAQPVRFAQFGDDVLTVGNFSAPDGVWIAPNKASNFVTIPGSPPNATVIVVAGLQAVAFVLDNWFSSAAGNVTDWTLSLATRADTGVLADAPGAVVAASPLFRSIVAFKKNVTYLGQQSFPEAWSWELISTQTGTWSQGCVIQLPDAVAFLGMDDFYMTTGYTPQRIPNNVKQWFFRTVNPLYIANTLGWYDEGNSILYWHFVSREAPDAPTCDRFVSYNTRAKRWCVGRLDVSSIPYLGMAATSLPNPGVPSIVIDGDFVPKGFTTFPSNMVLTTGYFGDPGRLSQLMRLLPVYNRAPCVQTLTPVCTDVLGQPDKVSEPATLGVDGWFYHRQYERYHKFILGMEGDCEITALIPELREGGLWGYGVDVPCPQTNLTVTSQVNPTDPVGNPEAPQLEVSGGNPEPVAVLGDSLPPQLTATGHPLGDLGGAHGLSATPGLSASGTVTGGGGGTPICAECPPGPALALVCCPPDGIGVCPLTCDTPLVMKACNGTPPYFWDIIAGNALATPFGADDSMAVIARGGAIAGAACSNIALAVTYHSLSPCPSSPGNTYTITVVMNAANKLDCDGNPTAAGVAGFGNRGTILMTMTGGLNCDGIALFNQTTLDNFGNFSGATGPLGPANGGPVSIHVQFTPLGGGTPYDHTFIINPSDDGTVVVDPSVIVDIRTQALINAGCTGCACDDDAPITVQVEDDDGNISTKVVP